MRGSEAPWPRQVFRAGSILVCVALAGVLVWEWWLVLGTAHSVGDFAWFYAVSRYVVGHGLGSLAHVYAYRVQLDALRPYRLAPAAGAALAPFVNPPTALLPMLPISLLPLPIAYAVWTTASFAGFVGALTWLFGTSRLLGPRGVVLLACATSFPVFINVAEGDLDFLVAVGVVVTVKAAQGSWRPGSVLGAALVSTKPQALLLWLVPAIRNLGSRLVQDVLGTLMVLSIASAAVFGPVGVEQMIRRVTSVPEIPSEHVTLLALFTTLLGPDLWANALAVIVFVALAVGAWLMWSLYPPETQSEYGYMVAAVTCASVAAAPYDLIQGLVVLAVPAVLVAADRSRQGLSLTPVLVAVVAVNVCSLGGFAGYMPLPLTSICLLLLAAAAATAWRREVCARARSPIASAAT